MANDTHDELMERLQKSGRHLVYQLPDQTVVAYSYQGRALVRQTGRLVTELSAPKRVRAVAEGHKGLPILGLL